jgi:superfamily I DNA/RNA helicase
MNWALGSLDRFAVISNSDAHSPDKLGREATVFDMELSYPGLSSALALAGGERREGPPGILETIEFFPQEGKYHLEGHRNCGVRLSAAETAAIGGLCPVCGKALTPGVMGRVLALADRPVDEEEPCPQDFAGTNRRPYRSLVPLREILAQLLGCGGASKKVDAAYNRLINSGGTELSILADLGGRDIEGLKVPGVSGELLAEAIGRMRSGRVSISPGYDGEYGVIRVFPAGQTFPRRDGTELFDLPPAAAPAADAPGPAAQEAARPAPRKAAPAAPRQAASGGPAGSAREKSAAQKAAGPAPRKAAPVASAASSPPAPEASAASTAPFVPSREQERIIAHKGRRALIIAGPGAGKTAVLAARTARLVKEGAAPSSILAVSFTVKAAAELRERILSSAGPGAAGIKATTFHAFCAELLREEGKAFVPDFKILGEAEREKLLGELCGSGGKAGRGISPRRLGDYIEERKRCLLLPGETSPPSGIDKILSFKKPPPAVPALEALYKRYREKLKDAALADYEDLIGAAVRLLLSRKEILEALRRRYRHVFVDEYQDINASQYALIRLLVPAAGELDERAADEGPALWVIGDPNQAIYGFRGADKAFIDRFAADYPGAARLELLKSFRCAGPILRAAGRLSGAALTSAAGEGGRVSLYRREYPSDKSEAEGIARTIAALLGGASFFALDSGAAGNGDEAASWDCAVLVRAAALAAPVVKALKDHGIPFELTGQSPWWDGEPVKDLLEFMRQQEEAGPSSGSAPAEKVMAAWEALIEGGRLPRYKKEAPEGVAELARLAGLFGKLPALLDALACGAGIPDIEKTGVKVMTIHASKGLEFDHVFVAGLEEGMLPFTLYDGEADIDEERRLLYVAMTRARRGLWLSMAKSRLFRGRKLNGRPSRFLSDLEDLVPLEAEKRPLKRDPQVSLF